MEGVDIDVAVVVVVVAVVVVDVGVEGSVGATTVVAVDDDADSVLSSLLLLSAVVVVEKCCCCAIQALRGRIPYRLLRTTTKAEATREELLLLVIHIALCMATADKRTTTTNMTLLVPVVATIRSWFLVGVEIMRRKSPFHCWLLSPARSIAIVKPGKGINTGVVLPQPPLY